MSEQQTVADTDHCVCGGTFYSTNEPASPQPPQAQPVRTPSPSATRCTPATAPAPTASASMSDETGASGVALALLVAFSWWLLHSSSWSSTNKQSKIAWLGWVQPREAKRRGRRAGGCGAVLRRVLQRRRPRSRSTAPSPKPHKHTCTPPNRSEE